MHQKKEGGQKRENDLWKAGFPIEFRCKTLGFC